MRKILYSWISVSLIFYFILFYFLTYQSNKLNAKGKKLITLKRIIIIIITFFFRKNIRFTELTFHSLIFSTYCIKERIWKIYRSFVFVENSFIHLYWICVFVRNSKFDKNHFRAFKQLYLYEIIDQYSPKITSFCYIKLMKNFV